MRKPDAVIHVEKNASKSCEVDFYVFQDKFVSPTRQNYYLVSFKDGQLVRVVLAETQRYSQAPGIQDVAEALRRDNAAQKPDAGSPDSERRHVLLSVQQEACAHLWAGAVEGEPAEDESLASEIQKQMFDDSQFALAKSHILAQLAPREDFSEDELQKLLHAEFLNDLLIYYVVDHPEIRIPPGTVGGERPFSRLISLDDLAQWKVSEEELFRVAMANINALERNRSYQETPVGEGKIFSITTPDGFAAARLLAIGMMGYWAQQAQDDLLVAIPTKDILYATPASNPEGITYIKELSDKQFQSLERPLTDKLFRFHVKDGTLSSFSDGGDNRTQSRRYLFLPSGLVHGGSLNQ